MRISDWSSDVCSSDLGCPIRAIKVSDGGQAGALDFVTRDEDPALGTMVENRRLRLALAAALADAPLVRLHMPAKVAARAGDAHGVTLTLDDGTTLEIGRASCRERVCKYV